MKRNTTNASYISQQFIRTHGTHKDTHTHTHTHTHRVHHHHYHHLVVPSARISLTLSRHSSLSFIASGSFSGVHHVSSQSFYMKVRAGRPAFSRPSEGVHRSSSLMSTSLLLRQWPAGLVRLTLIVFIMGGRWSYSCCFGGVASRTSSILLEALLCSCPQASSPSA